MVADDAPVTGRGVGRPFQVELRKGALSGSQFTFLQKRDASAREARAKVQVHACPVAQGSTLALEQLQVHVNPLSDAIQGFGHDPIAAVELPATKAGPAQIEGEALPGMPRVGLPVAGLHSANPYRDSVGLYEESVTHCDPAGEGGSGHHHSRSADAERAVDGEAKVPSVSARTEGGGALLQELHNRLDTLAGQRADRQNRRAGERGRGEEIAYRGAHRSDPSGVHPVRSW